MPDRADALEPRGIRRLGLTVGIALIGLLAFAPVAGATVITVNTTNDQFNTGAECSLREAVEAANTNAIVSGCPAGLAGAFDPDTINVPAGTYALTLSGVGANGIGDLDVTDTNLTIQNTGGGQTTINGAAGGDRVIEIGASAFSVGIAGIRITGGSTNGVGGGIANGFSGSALGLTNVTVDGNSGGAGGGGIYSGPGTALSLKNVTVSGNNAGVGDGGGVLYSTANGSFFENSTIFGNEAENGGGIANAGGGIVNISNTLLAGNVGGGEPGDCSGTITSGNNNVVGTDLGCTIAPFAGGSDLIGADHAEIPANLGALADNGGTVLTHPPLRTSPALNRGYISGGGTFCQATDARGTARPQEGRCDIGAVEALPPGPQTYAATTTADEFDGAFSGTSCSLREAVTAANTKQATGGCQAGAGGGVTNTIQLAPGTYTLTRSGVDDTNVNGDLDILASGSGTVIAGTGSAQTTIDGNGLITSDRVLHGHLGLLGGVISGVNIRNGNSLNNGGGVLSNGDLVLRGVALTGNYAEWNGGGVYYTTNASGDISNSTVSGNQATLDGGGMYSADNFAPRVNNVTVTQNEADPFGFMAGLVGGGGIAGFTGGQIANTIIAGNTDTLGAPDCASVASPWQGHNLIGDAGGCNFVAATGDQFGTGANPIPTGLGPLANNGGRTLTHAPAFGSAVLNAGNPATPSGSFPACLTSDQLGTVRPLAGRCEIGAVELDPAAPVVAQPALTAPTGTGQRAAALKKCKKKKTAKARKKCKKKAKRLPV